MPLLSIQTSKKVKTTLKPEEQLLLQVAERGESAVVYDPVAEHSRKVFDAERGHIVLNPLDARCPYWGPTQEMQPNTKADAIAAS